MRPAQILPDFGYSSFAVSFSCRALPDANLKSLTQPVLSCLRNPGQLDPLQNVTRF